jgi:hypothetical protein
MNRYFALALSILLQPLVSCLGENRPNILFISIDDFNDWGPTQLGGEPFDVDTPNFDSLKMLRCDWS